MPSLQNPAHEAFAQARFAGKSLTDAYEIAGLSSVAPAKEEASAKDGATRGKTTAFNLNRQSDIRERIAELHRAAADQSIYDKTSAVRDLVAIIHAAPSEAAADHPLCELRTGKDGHYHRFPPKLQAMARLIKLMGWTEPVSAQRPSKNYFTELLADARRSRQVTSSPPSPPGSGTNDFLAGSATCQVASQPPCSEPSPGHDPGIEADRQPFPSDPAPHTLAENSPQPPSTDNPLPPPDLAPWVRLLPDDSRYAIHPNYANGELTPRQEAFAQFRFKGMGVMEAYHAAGYNGHAPNLAWRLNSKPAVKARIADLNRHVEHAAAYDRNDAIRDLVTIIRACPSTAGPDHPYCEMRMTSWGAYHRFPSKLGAITLLARMLGWNPRPGDPPSPSDPLASFKSLAQFLAARS